VHPHGWHEKKRRPKASTFVDDPGRGLSVFDATRATPYKVIMNAIDQAKANAASDDENVRQRGISQLEKYGTTVAEWIKNNWRVVRLPIAAFRERDFTMDGPEDNGHVNLFGDYTLHSSDLVDIAELVPDEEILAPTDRPASETS
jgi:hypothetical protein